MNHDHASTHDEDLVPTATPPLAAAPASAVRVRPHGTRARYVFGPTGSDWRDGCRCFECSQAAVLYEKRRVAARRRGDEAFVDATRTREHLRRLSEASVGLRTVAERSGVSRSALAKVASGRVTRVRPATEAAVLRVTREDSRPGAYVDAAPTVAMLEDLLTRAGLSRSEVARRLGYSTRALQIARNGRVSRRNADAVAALWRDVMAPLLADRERATRRQREVRAARRDLSAG